jgi:hypothetical protein
MDAGSVSRPERAGESGQLLALGWIRQANLIRCPVLSKTLARGPPSEPSQPPQMPWGWVVCRGAPTLWACGRSGRARVLARSRAGPPERLLTPPEGAHGACHGCEGMGETPRKLCFEIPILRQLPSQATRLVFVYDAGPCGSWLSRSLTTKGYDCWGVAPAPLPKQAGDRVKTDRRAALKLAQLLRLGDLTPVSVPTREEEAMRALCRARDEALRDLSRFDNPRPLMDSLGLTPSASSRGARRRPGAMTKAWHTHARRALVAGAWAYRYPKTVRRP